VFVVGVVNTGIINTSAILGFVGFVGFVVFFGIVSIVDVIGGGIAVKTVLLTSITAKQVNITTQDHTQLTGSLIAATDTGDKDGNDNGQLSLTTNSLSVVDWHL
jgi:hypothetical protein